MWQFSVVQSVKIVVHLLMISEITETVDITWWTKYLTSFPESRSCDWSVCAAVCMVDIWMWTFSMNGGQFWYIVILHKTSISLLCTYFIVNPCDEWNTSTLYVIAEPCGPKYGFDKPKEKYLGFQQPDLVYIKNTWPDICKVYYMIIWLI